MPAPSQLARHATRLNALIDQEVGTNPRFGWQWGADMVVKMPSHNRDGTPRIKPHEWESPAGLTIISHEPIEIDFLVVPREFHKSFVFCFEDSSPLARVRWAPWCPAYAYTPDLRKQVTILHSPPNQAPDRAYTLEIIAQVKLALAERQVAQEQLRLQMRNMLEEREQREHRSAMARIGMQLADTMPVGVTRKAGTKTHVSFPSVSKE